MGLFTPGGLLIGAAVLLPMAALLGVFVAIARRNARRAAAAAHWPFVQGIVQASAIERRRGADSDGGNTYAYYPAVAYRYEVRGRRHAGRRIFVGQEIGTGTPGPAERIVARFPVGASVPVFYDPADPAMAVLDRSAPSTRFWWLIAAIMGGALLFVVALMVGIELYIGGMHRSIPR